MGEYYELKQRIEASEIYQKDMEAQYRINLLSEEFVDVDKSDLINYISVVEGNAWGDIVFTPQEFFDAVDNYSGYRSQARLKLKLDMKCSEKDLIVLSFNAVAEKEAIDLSVRCGNISNTVTVTNTEQAYYVIVSGVEEISSVELKLPFEYQPITISGVNLVNFKNVYSVNELKTGVYDQTQYDTIVLESSNKVLEECSQLLVKNQHVFTLSADKSSLIAYKKENGNYIEVSSIIGMGMVRDMQFTSDMNTIVLTARQNGVYFVDISTPENISLVSHYDSLEYATGLHILDTYAFICSRYFGIEVVDISDINNPTFVCKIDSNGCEYQDCYVDENYLYVGVYSDKRVDIFDISELSDIKKVSEIQLGGSGQGVYVKEGILYAATALDADEKEKNLYQYSVGTGNGFEMYDISDPESPVLLSKVKVDGRLSINALDVWDIVVAGDYAFLSNMFGGGYLYDVSDPKKPVRVREYKVVAFEGNDDFVDYDESKYIFPYNSQKETHGCVYHIVPENGFIYIVTPNMGVFEVKEDLAVLAEQNYAQSISCYSSNVEIPQIRNYFTERYATSKCVWAVDVDENYVYLANGDAGIQILDKDLELILEYKTMYSVKDIIVKEGVIYTAESEGGLGIYRLEGEQVIPVSLYAANSKIECYTQIEMSGDSRYIIAETSISSYELIDVSDIANPKRAMSSEKDTGLMYYRTICTGLVNEAIFGIAGANNQYWYGTEEGELKLVSVIQNSLYSRSSGFTAVGDKCLAIYNNGYVYFDPLTGEFSDKVKIQSITFDGKCCANEEGNKLVISTEYNGKVQIVDIKNINSPRLMAEFYIEGNPDLATWDNEVIYLPCRYYGLLRMTPE